eukprot:gnl/TRDRNA2_/TRDRNA2_176023_c0_seq2.p1 gnl/TRDRNA2_/TRDRNA2_176023_c0~~gnl/TRDRNA2_/TRDRNA2_176023_c0_seq2.p1  ORF type:complete len:269 (+),score=-5.29 gnl/TRDRNA2_/TRDRNA2_176023_c0_seq2:123-929(+)
MKSSQNISCSKSISHHDYDTASDLENHFPHCDTVEYDKIQNSTKRKHVFIPKTKQKSYRPEMFEPESKSTLTKEKIVEKQKIEIPVNEKSMKETNNSSINPDSIETDDDVDEEWALMNWKNRELSRLKRDKREKIDREKSQASFGHSRLNSISCTNTSNCASTEQSKTRRKERAKMKFLQKYYHKGAFFQADGDDRFESAGSDPIYLRDYWLPTAADRFDKTLLPVVMQVKNFGLRGRTKWTHLVAEDTTQEEKQTMNILDCKRKYID